MTSARNASAAAPAAPARPEGQSMFAVVRSGFARLGDFAMLPVLVAMVLIFSLVTDGTLSSTNLINVLSQSTIVATAAIGATFVILTAGIDLSAGSVISASGVAAAWAMVHTGNIVVGVLTGVTAGMVAGLVIGLLIARLNLVPFVVTLAGLFVIGGTALLLSKGTTIAPTPTGLTTWNFSVVAGIPAPVLAVAVLLVLAQLSLTKTTWGRKVILIGANPRTAEVSGVHVTRILISVYLIAGALSALAGFLMTANLTGANASMGSPMLLNIVGAVVLGGTSLFGGRGSITRTVIGALLLGFLSNGMNLLGFAPYDQQIVTGAVILLAVGIDTLTHRPAR